MKLSSLFPGLMSFFLLYFGVWECGGVHGVEK